MCDLEASKNVGVLCWCFFGLGFYFFTLVNAFLLLMEIFTLRPLTSAVESNESKDSSAWK